MKNLFSLLLAIIFMLFVNVQAQTSKNVTVLGNWDDKTIPPIGSDPQRLNEIWGFSVGENEYAVIGSTIGIHIIDVTDPKNPKLQDYIKGSASGSHVVHRDFHDYNGYLYMVADEGVTSKLQIADISKLPSTGKAPVVYESSDLLITAHNIFVDSATKKLYACGVADKDGSKDLEIYSLEDPAKPKHLKDYSIAYVHDIYVKNDTAFLNCGSALNVVSFEDTQNPKLLGSLKSYPDKGYNHSGWTTEDFQYYFLADETRGMKIKTVDISDYSDLKAINTFDSERQTESLVHNLIVKGNFLYVSYYHDGFYVFNVKDPKNPTIAGFYDTYLPDASSGFYGAWGVYPFLPSGNILVSDMESGLWVFDVSKITVGVPDNAVKNNEFIIGYNQYIGKISLVNRQPKGGNFTVDLFSSTGKLVKHLSKGIDAHEKIYLEGSAITPGAYLVKISGKNYNQVGKVLIY